MNKKTIFLSSLFALLLVSSVYAGIDANGTVNCDGTTENWCNVIQGPAAGLGKFFEYLGSVGGFFIVLAIIGVIAAIGFAIAAAVKALNG